MGNNYVNKMVRNILFEKEAQRKGAGFFIFDTDGRLLLTHPAGDASGTNIWSIPKGKIEETDASELEAAYREVKEETSLDLKNMSGDVNKIGESTYKNHAGTVKACVFFSFVSKEKIYGNYKVVCSSLYNGKPENDENRWVTPAEAKDMLADYQFRALEYFLQNK